MRHKITGFQRYENATLDPIMLSIAVFSRLGLLSGTVEEVFKKAALHSNGEIMIGTLADA